MEEHQNDTLVAFSPKELQTCQSTLSEWCDKKMGFIKDEIFELKENLAIAQKNKWRSSGIANAVRRLQKRVLFYEKIKAAIAAGYLVVPDFPIDVFAIRTAREYPLTKYESQYKDQNKQEPQMLPVGDGEYKNPFPSNESVQRKEGEKWVTRFRAGEFEDIDFPVQIAVPQVLNATSKAMSLKLFDEIGLVRPPSKRGDPIVVGTVIHKQGYSTKRLNFFIGWWFNWNDL